MICSKCGSELPEESKFCNNCGYRLLIQEDSNLKTKAEFLPTIKSEEINDFEIKNNDETAKDILDTLENKINKSIYNINKKNVKIISAVVVGLLLIVLVGIKINAYNQYTKNIKQGDTSMSNGKYDEAIKSYNAALKFNNNSAEANDKLSKAKQLELSTEDFSTATTYFNEKNYLSALSFYKDVIKEDSKNYSVSLDQIENCKKLIVSDYIEKAKICVAKKDYDMAISWMNSALAIDGTSKQVIDLKANYTKAKAEVDAEAKAKAEADAKAQAERDAKAQAEAQAQAKAKAKTEGVSLGMTQQQVLDSMWGKPDQINKTTSSYGTYEQWVYGMNSSKMNFLYFENGILTDIQN